MLKYLVKGKYILFPLLMGSLLCFDAQAQARKLVIFQDLEHKGIIPYVGIQSSKTKEKIYANDRGEVLISFDPIDTLFISCTGYESIISRADQLFERKEFCLRRKIILLDEVLVYSRTDTAEFDIGNEWPLRKETDYSLLQPNKNIAFGVKFKNPCREKKILSKISFKLRNGDKASALFRVHLNRLDKTLIWESLLKDEIIAESNQVKRDLLVIDMSSKDIMISGDSILLGLEFIGFRDNKNQIVDSLERKAFIKKPAVYLEKSRSYPLLYGFEYAGKIAWFEGHHQNDIDCSRSPYFWITVK